MLACAWLNRCDVMRAFHLRDAQSQRVKCPQCLCSRSDGCATHFTRPIFHSYCKRYRDGWVDATGTTRWKLIRSGHPVLQRSYDSPKKPTAPRDTQVIYMEAMTSRNVSEEQSLTIRGFQIVQREGPLAQFHYTQLLRPFNEAVDRYELPIMTTLVPFSTDSIVNLNSGNSLRRGQSSCIQSWSETPRRERKGRSNPGSPKWSKGQLHRARTSSRVSSAGRGRKGSGISGERE